jgi:glycosyltransferase involved in cell wall biosynthesis
MDGAVSIVIPCFNEATNLRHGVLEQVIAYAERDDRVREVLVVDDGSVDDSRDLIARAIEGHPKLRLLANSHRGKAGTVLSGMLAASGDFVLMCDLDLATPIDELDRLIPCLASGYDVVVGSRSRNRAGAPMIRRLMGPGFMLIRGLLVNVGGVRDTQCGFKCFRREVIAALAPILWSSPSILRAARGPAVTAAFDVEVLYLANRLGCRIAEVPVRWQHVGTKRVSPVRESWRGLRGLVGLRLRSLRGEYDAGLARAREHLTGGKPERETIV